MKNINYIKKNIKGLFLAVVAVTSLASCNNEFSSDDPNFGGTPAAPIITSVSEANEDKVVTQGVLENTYIIRGENLATLLKVYFNGYPASVNTAYVTDNVAFITVPEDAPYKNYYDDSNPPEEVEIENIMRLETLGGIVEYDFSLLTIEEFTEEFIGTVKVVNLIGGDFSETSSVTFVSGNEEDGTLVERPAEILSITQTEVVAAVPAGVEQAFIYLETSRGAIARSDSYGFNYSIYIDALHPDWELGGWGGTYEEPSTEQALGASSIKSIREGWSGLTFLMDDGFNLNDYEFVTLQVYANTNAERVNLAFNDFEVIVTLDLEEGEWKKFLIPVSDWYPNGAPSNITRLDFQEASNTGLAEYIFFVDDFGFI